MTGASKFHRDVLTKRNAAIKFYKLEMHERANADEASKKGFRVDNGEQEQVRAVKSKRAWARVDKVSENGPERKWSRAEN